jgi:hypothetical protein
MEPEGSLPCSQQPASGSYSEVDESSPRLPTFISLRSMQILSFHLHLGLPSCLFPSGIENKVLFLKSPMLSFYLLWLFL